ncbi:mucin-associated surface protein (MASP), putative, partial [Trypanosoma cruzi marinkellei]
MMMTGRVLLVCALCVLWCGAGGGCEEVPGVSHSDMSSKLDRDGGHSQDSSRSQTPASHTSGPEPPAPNDQQEAVFLPPSEDSLASSRGAADMGKDVKNEDPKGLEKEKKVEGKSEVAKNPEKENLQSQLLSGTHEVETITSSKGSLLSSEDQQGSSSSVQLHLPNNSPHANPPSTSEGGRDNEKSHEQGNVAKDSQLSVVEDIEKNKDAGVKAVASTGGGEDSRLTVTTVEEMSDTTTKGD